MLGGEGFGLRGLGFYVYEDSMTSCSSPYMKPKGELRSEDTRKASGFQGGGPLQRPSCSVFRVTGLAL